MRALSSAACTVHGSLQNLRVFFLGPRPAGLPATPPAPALLLRRAPQARPELGDCTLEGPVDLCSGTGCRVRARMLFKIFLYFPVPCLSWGFPGGSDSKESACNAGNPGSIPGSGRSPWRWAWQPAAAFLTGESPWAEEPGGLQSTGSQTDTAERPLHTLLSCRQRPDTREQVFP